MLTDSGGMITTKCNLEQNNKICNKILYVLVLGPTEEILVLLQPLLVVPVKHNF